MKPGVNIWGPRYVSIFFSVMFHAFCGHNIWLFWRTRITTTPSKFWPLIHLYFFYNTTHCLPILSLWTLNVYIVTKIQSNFHANRTVILAVTCNSRQKNGWFWFFAKNIFHPQNHKYGKWGRFLYKEKNQTHRLCFSMRLIFLVFWFLHFLSKFRIPCI